MYLCAYLGKSSFDNYIHNDHKKMIKHIENTKKTTLNSPAPAINTQKEKKSKKIKKCKKIKKNAKTQKEKNMQKEQQNIKFYFRASY